MTTEHSLGFMFAQDAYINVITRYMSTEQAMKSCYYPVTPRHLRRKAPRLDRLGVQNPSLDELPQPREYW